MKDNILRILVASLVPALLSACSVLQVVNAFAPDSGSSVVDGIAYGDHPRQQLDVYTPVAAADDAAVVVFFYGGSWDSGKRQDYEFVARKLAAMGHYVIVPDYRIYPEVIFPEFVRDGALVTAYVLGHLPEIAGRRRPVFLMGHSAGAQIAMLVAVDRVYLGPLGYDADELAGVIGLAGPYDFLPLESARLRKIFPTPDALHNSQAINFADGGDPPVFLVHGDADKRVWLRNSTNMASRLEQSGGDVTLKVYPGVTHTGVIKPFIPYLDADFGLLDDIKTFISSRQMGSRKKQ